MSDKHIMQLADNDVPNPTIVFDSGIRYRLYPGLVGTKVQQNNSDKINELSSDDIVRTAESEADLCSRLYQVPPGELCLHFAVRRQQIMRRNCNRIYTAACQYALFNI